MKCRLLLFFVPFLYARSVYGQGASDVKIERLGEVDVRGVPHANPHSQKLTHLHVLPEDPELFQGEKLQAQNAATGFPASAVTETPSTLHIGVNFAGLTFADSGAVPPDTLVTAGSNSGALNLVESVNETIRISDGSGGTINTIDMCSFFLCDFFTALISDPIFRFDPASGRWFASVVTFEYVPQGISLVLEGQWRVAASQTGDPNSVWNVFALTMTNGTFPDFPKLAVSTDKVVLTGDSFTISTNRFKGTEFAVLSKADVIAVPQVQAPAFQYFAPPQGLFALAAAELLPSSSVTSTIYLAAVGSSRNGSSSIRVWQINGAPTVSGTGVTLATTDYSVSAFKTPPNAPQLGTSTLIDTNGDLLVDAFYQSGHLWVTANSGCVPAGDTATRSCLRFVEITPGANHPVTQDLTFGEKGQYYYYPAIRPDTNGNLIAIFNRSSLSEYVGVYASGQLTGAPNTFQTPVQVKAGETSYNVSPPRWGDYSGATVDVTNPLNVWIGGEYSQSVTGGANQWATWIAQLHF